MKSKNAFPMLVLSCVILFVSLACGISLGTTSTQAPPYREPTQPPGVPPTRAPTNTVRPTPDFFATQWAGMEQEIRAELADMDLPADEGYLEWYQTEPISISVTGPGGRYIDFLDYLVAADFVLFTEFTWDTNSWPTCGLWFRAGEEYTNDDFYALQFLRFSGLPAFDIEYFRGGEYMSIITQEIRFSDFLDINDGATNAIALAAVGNEFKIYVNGHFEGRYYDYSSYLSEGRFAFLATQDSGDTTCTFNNTWIWLYP